MAAAILPTAGAAVPPAGASAIIGGSPAPLTLLPTTYQTRFGNAKFDLLRGQYQVLHY